MALGLAQNAILSKNVRCLKDAWENGARSLAGGSRRPGAQRASRWIREAPGEPKRSAEGFPEGPRRALRERPPKESGSRACGGPPCRSPGEPAQQASRGPSEDPLESQGGSKMSGRPQGVPERQEAPQRARPSSGGVLRLSSAFFPRLRLQVSEGSPRVFKEQPWENRGKTLGRPLENPCNA